MRLPLLCLSLPFFLAMAAPPHASADTLDMIKARGAIVIGYRDQAPPFSSLGADNQPRGYSIELCNRIAAAVKIYLGNDKLEIRYQPVTAENRIDKLEAGEIDIECGVTTRTLGRQERVDFTLFTFISGTELLVPQASAIHGTKDLESKKIAVQPGTTTEAVMKRILSLRTITAEFVPVADAAQGLAALESGKVDALAADQIVLIGLASAAKDPSSLRLSGYLYSYEPYAFMVRKNDAAFRLIADRTLALIFQNGEIGEIYRKAFGQWNPEPPPMIGALFAIESLTQ